MQTGHISLVTSMLGDFKYCAPAKVLAPLQGVLDAATRRGRAFFNVRASACPFVALCHRCPLIAPAPRLH